MIYRCIKDFGIPWLGENGENTEIYGYVVCDSLWEVENCNTISGAELKLNSLDYDEGKTEFQWIEVPKERLESNFILESDGE